MLQTQTNITGNSSPFKQKQDVQSPATIVGNQAMLNALDNGAKPIQRIVPDWGNLVLPAGTHVYHGTSQVNANSIIGQGILPVQNGFGGGQLGPGFYTYTDPQQAQLFGDVVLHFVTNAELNGQDVPPGMDWGNLPPEAINGNDFLHTEEDPNQYKFHNGALTLNYLDMEEL